MMLSADFIVDLVSLPDLGGIPFGEVLEGMVRADLEPRATRELLERANARLAAPVLRPKGVEDGGYLVEERVLFPETSSWWVVFQEGEERLSTALPEEEVRRVADFFRVATHARTRREVREAWPFDEEAWREKLVVSLPSQTEWPEPEGPGIYRREHASLLIRSRTTGLLVDPIGLQRRLPNMRQAPHSSRLDAVDAVAITHGHVDHWHVPSLLAQLARPDLPVLVPRVPRPSLLTFQDFAATLRACGQTVQAPAWGETVRVGDLEIDILPFRGEQPTREGPRLREGLRNWGNCYRINTEDFSCVLLVDSGVDPEGGVAEVLAESCRRRGPVDVVLSCQREFQSPFFGGLSHYWAALPWERLRALHGELLRGQLPSTTAGVQGTVEACAVAKARYFLAYANGFEGVGRPITDIGWGLGEPSEASSNARLREELARQGLGTQVLEWCPGDVARMERGQVTLSRGTER
jgi:L-ascorbate metabolism protein UlaG (beta-lactamase superfamily)